MTTTTTAPAVNLSMSAIRKAMPEFFAANVAGLVTGLAQSGARLAMLADALTGAAIERAQSGNMPAKWAEVDAAALTLKAGAKTRVCNALAHILTIKPASVKGADIALYGDFAAATRAALVAMLTPPAPAAQVGEPKETSAQKIERLTAELASVTIERDAMRAMLVAAGLAVPAHATDKAPATV